MKKQRKTRKQKKLREKLIIELFEVERELENNKKIVSDYTEFLKGAEEDGDHNGVIVLTEDIEKFSRVVEDLEIRRKFLLDEIGRL